MSGSVVVGVKRLGRIGVWMLGAWALLLTAACEEDAPGCQVDADCRGGRVCVAHACQDPAANNNDLDAGNNANNQSNNAVNNAINNRVNNSVNNNDDVGPDVPDPIDVIEPECVNDGLCPEGSFCQDNVCVPGCHEGSCPDGLECDLDTRECVGGGCDGDGTCPDEAWCNDGVCVEGCREGGCPDGLECDLDTRECIFGRCDGDGDCPDEAWCNDGVCAEGCREDGCPGGRTCDLDTRACVTPPCQSDANCSDGQWCDEGACVQGCREGGCPDGLTCDLDTRTCVGGGCNIDQDCPAEAWCDEGACVQGCREGGCPDGQTCDLDLRACVTPPCQSDAACDVDEYCSDGACLSGCRVGGCPQGQTCDLDTRVCEGPVDTTPDIAVEPEAIDFGDVEQRESAFASITVSNTGGGELRIGAVGFSRGPTSTGFQIIPPEPGLPVLIAPGASKVWRVRFEPVFLQNNQPTEYGNDVVFESNDPDEASVEVPLVGTGVPNQGACLRFEPREADFGYVEPGDVATEQVGLQNCGASALMVQGIAVEGDEDGVFQAVIGGQFPRTLQPNQTLGVAVNYIPASNAPQLASLIATGEGGLRAEAILVADGPGCPSAEIALEGGDGEAINGALIVAPGAAVRVSGGGSEDPSGGELRWLWTVTGPRGATVPAPGDGAEEFEFAPTAPGVYTIRLSVESETTGVLSCEEALARVLVPAATITVEWGDFSDLDLHVLRSQPDGTFGPLGSSQNVVADDCYFANRNADWGVQGNPNDNGVYLIDDQDGFGPEVVALLALEADRDYRFVARIAAPRSFDTEATFTIQVGDLSTEVSREGRGQGFEIIGGVLHGDGTVEPAP